MSYHQAAEPKCKGTEGNPPRRVVIFDATPF